MRKRRGDGEGEVFQPTYTENRLKRRTKVWHIRYRDANGHRVREATGSEDRRVALAVLRDRLDAVEKGRPTGRVVEGTTVGDLCSFVVNDYTEKERKSLGRLHESLAHIKGFFGEDAKAKCVDTASISAYKAQRKRQEAANGTINRELSALRRGFRLAKRARRVAYVPDFELLPEGKRRTGFFEPDQFQAVLEQLPVDLKPVAGFAYISGWRVDSEITTRTWAHVDFENGFVRLEPGETKNGEGRSFPFTPELRALLERQRERTVALEKATGKIIPWVFWRLKGLGVREDGQQTRGFYKAWRSACRRAGVPGRLRHDFRRTAVMNLELAGVLRSTAMDFVGHKTESIYRRYAIPNVVALRQGAEKLAALHASQREAPAPPKVVSIGTKRG
jgi:integrase